VPVNEYGLIMNDQPVLCGPGSSKEYADRVRFIGDQVAVVVAESEEIAAHARDLIEVDYEDLPVEADMLAGDAAQMRSAAPGARQQCRHRITASARVM
jgi:CO/xanthine dehydrogenase Mo-binding subunit